MVEEEMRGCASETKHCGENMKLPLERISFSIVVGCTSALTYVSVTCC